MTEHLAGLPVSEASYTRGCRCDDCRSARNARMRERRRRTGTRTALRPRTENIARGLAAAWLRSEHPDVWASIWSEASRRSGLSDAPKYSRGAS